MKAFSCITVEEAVATIAQNYERGQVFFCDMEKARALQDFCRMAEAEGVDMSHVVICSSSGVFSSLGFAAEGIAGFSYDRSTGTVVVIDSPPVLSIEKLRWAYDRVKENDRAFVILLSDGLSFMEDSIAGFLFSVRQDFKIIAGSAGDDLRFSQTLVSVGGRRGLAVAIFINYPGRSCIVRENTYEPTGTRLLVTDADPVQRIVRRLNDEPAVTAYARAIGVPESELLEQCNHHPLGKKYVDGLVIAALRKANADGSLSFDSQIMLNSWLYVLRPLNPRMVMEKMFQSIPFQPSFVLSVHCILRSDNRKQKRIWKDADKSLPLWRNHAGLVGYGELYHRRFVNQTMVLFALEL